MLGKLIKNEIKSTVRTIQFIYLAAAVTALALLVAYFVDITWLSVLGSVLMLVEAIALLLMTFVVVFTNFQKTMYGPQGYLTFTLPVTSRALIGSKLLVSALWLIVAYVGAMGMMVGTYYYITSLIGEETMEMVKLMMNMLNIMPNSSTLYTMLVLIALNLFIQMIYLVAIAFFCVSAANTRRFQKSPTFYTFLIFFAVYIVLQLISFYLTQQVPLSILINSDGVQLITQAMGDAGGYTFGITGVLFSIVTAVGLLWATSYIMKQKVNLK